MTVQPQPREQSTVLEEEPKKSAQNSKDLIDDSSSDEGDCNSVQSEDNLTDSEMEELEGNIFKAMDNFDSLF